MELHPMLEPNTIPNTDLWYVLSTCGDCPSIRVGHTCTYIKGKHDSDINGKLYVIGGANPSGAFCDTFVLDLNTCQWDIMDLPGFRARYEHAAFIPPSSPEKIFIFGGADNTGNMNDIQILDTVKNTWTTAAVSGTPPSPRTFHTNSIIGDRLVVYSGGHTQAEPVPDRQVYFLDTVSMSWSTKVIKGDAPKPRHGHVMVAIGDNQLYLHGGMARSSFFDDFHCLDLTKNSWSHIKNKKMYPTARAGHSGTAAGTMLFIYGGMNRDGALDDLYRYDTSCKTWCKMELAGPPPSCRLDFGMCTVELTRDLPTSENGSGDILGTSRHAQEMLELALKPGSASSRSSSNIGSASSRDQQLHGSANSRPESRQVGSAGSRESYHEYNYESSSTGNDIQTLEEGENLSDEEETPRAEGATSSLFSDSSKPRCTMKMVLIHGGMDTEGEIFDDTLVYMVE